MKSFLPRALATVAAFSLLTLGASCSLLEKLGNQLGDHEGSPCSGKVGLCKDDSHALICNEGKYALASCRGPQGCKVAGKEMTCDSSLNSEDDTCPAVWEGTGSCRGTGKWVSCQDGHYTVLDCRGKKGCQQTGKTSTCDQSVVDEGDACSEDDTASCSESASEQLTCKKGKMGSPIPCRGPLKCHVSDDGKKNLCDQSLVKEGDACTGDGGACSLDGGATMHCTNGKYVASHVCRGGGCATKDTVVACADMGLAEPGDPCHGEVAACSVDHKSFLDCKSGKFAVTRKCNCATENGSVQCK